MNLPFKPEVVAEVVRLESGTLVIRPRGGQGLKLTGFAETAKQADGGFIVRPLDEEIETEQAGAILGVPWSTLRRMIDLGAVEAYKRSPARWTVSLRSVLECLERRRTDPEFWSGLKGSETTVQEVLKL